MRLLLAEDDAALSSVLARGLREAGYVLDTVGRGDDALHMLRLNEYAAVVVDWRMPGMDGLEVIKAMRRLGMASPVLMLTARDTAADRVEGLDGGADDYLVKPFDFSELLARLRALLRRPPGVESSVLRRAALTVDPSTREAASGGHDLRLTATEFAILEVLVRRSPAVVDRKAIAAHAWEDDTVPLGSNTIEVHVARLRAKLAGAGVSILTVRGTGYRLVEG
ncbi:MAG TPA: response regulator transcription factor [Candidatus Angelobacter sp.]|jgi:DNA-binding response OmpR family regulator|nr:response regulator transcription factor [Candidatus Angelobacter sp.]